MPPAVADSLHLNDEQRRCLEALDQPLRVIAGPGTGKTHTVVAMYLHLLQERDLRPGQVLLLTFSNNAAAELRARIDSHWRSSYDESWVSTFHAFATRLLTRHGRAGSFHLLNGFQERLLMRRVIAALPDLESLEPLRQSASLTRDALWLVGILKQNLIDAPVFAGQVAGSGNPKLRDLATIYDAYARAQAERGLLDHRDVIAGAVRLLEDDLALCRELGLKFEQVIVDEFQDVDPAQVRLLDLLTSAREPRRLAVVGDANQSVYQFRGTLPEFLTDDFERRFGGLRIDLTRNYRSYSQVLKPPLRVLTDFGLPVPEVVCDRDPMPLGEGPGASLSLAAPLMLRREQTPTDEAAAVARHIRSLVLDGDGRRDRPYGYGDFAIILRSVRQYGRPFEDALRAAGVPYETGSQPAFAGNEVVRFALAALRALAAPDDEAALAEIVNSPLSGIPSADASRLRREAERRGRPLVRVLQHTMFLLAGADPARWPLPWAADPPLIRAGEQELQAEVAAADAAEPEPGPGAPPPPPRNSFFEQIGPAGRDGLHAFVSAWLPLRALAPGMDAESLAYRALADLGVLQRLTGARSDASSRRSVLGPLRLFLRAAAETSAFVAAVAGGRPDLGALVELLPEALPEYVDELEAPGEREQGDAVRLLTVHAAKGLQFPVVFVPALAAQVFPVMPRARTPLLEAGEMRWMESSLAGFQPPWPPDERHFLEEEARLAYVAMTRAQDHLVLSWADEYDGQPALPGAFLEAALGCRPEELDLEQAGVAHLLYTRLREGVRSPSDLLSVWEAREALTQARAQEVAGPVEGADGQLDLLAPAPLPPPMPWQPWAGARLQVRPTHHDSASSLGNLLACPRKYYYAQLLRFSDETSRAQERGSAFHEVLRRFYQEEPSWRADAQAARGRIREIADEVVGPFLMGAASNLDRRIESNQFRKLIENFLASELSDGAPVPRTLAVEHGFEWRPEPDLQVIGRIDRLIALDEEGGVEVVDYKTGGAKSATELLKRYFDDPRMDFQLLIYYFAVAEGAMGGLGPLRPWRVGLWYPKDTYKNGTIHRACFSILEGGAPPPSLSKLKQAQTSDVPLSHERVEGGRLAVLAGLREARSGLYRPSPRHGEYTCVSTWGSACEFAWMCPGRIEEPAEQELV